MAESEPWAKVPESATIDMRLRTLRVFWVMSRYTNRRRRTWITQAAIADRIGLAGGGSHGKNRTTVAAEQKELLARGLIRPDGKHVFPSGAWVRRYVVAPYPTDDAESAASPLQSTDDAESPASAPEPMTAVRDTDDADSGRTDDADSGRPMTRIPRHKQSTEQSTGTDNMEAERTASEEPNPTDQPEGNSQPGAEADALDALVSDLATEDQPRAEGEKREKRPPKWFAEETARRHPDGNATAAELSFLERKGALDFFGEITGVGARVLRQRVETFRREKTKR